MTTKKRGLLSSTKTLVILSLICALSIVLEKFVGINTPVFTLNLGYLPVALSGMYLALVEQFCWNTSGLNKPYAVFNIFLRCLHGESTIYGLFFKPVSG